MLSFLAGYRTYIFCGIAVVLLLTAMIVHCNKGPKMTTKQVNVGGVAMSVQVPAAVDPAAPVASPYDLEFWLQIGGMIAVALAGVYRFIGQKNWINALSTGAGLFDALSKAFVGKPSYALQDVKQVLTKIGEQIPASPTPPTGGSVFSPPAARSGEAKSPVLLNLVLILVIIGGIIALLVALRGNGKTTIPSITAPASTKPTGELASFQKCRCTQTGECTCIDCHCSDSLMMPVAFQGTNRDQGPVAPVDQRDQRYPSQPYSPREMFGIEEMAKAIREVLAWAKGAGSDLDKKYIDAKATAGNVALGTTIMAVLNLAANIVSAVALLIIAAGVVGLTKAKAAPPSWMTR